MQSIYYILATCAMACLACSMDLNADYHRLVGCVASQCKSLPTAEAAHFLAMCPTLIAMIMVPVPKLLC
jgi:hypothetical protein